MVKMQLKRGANGITELKFILHEEGSSGSLSQTSAKKPNTWSSNSQEKIDQKATAFGDHLYHGKV